MARVKLVWSDVFLYTISNVNVHTLISAGVYRLSCQRDDNIVMDAVGPEIYTFVELVRLISDTIRTRTWIVHLPPRLVLLFTKLLGYALRDIVITRGEVTGLMSNLLISEGSPTAKTRLSEWLEQNADNVGVKYASELERHYR